MIVKPLSALLVAALSLLQGCGGGGDDSLPVDAGPAVKPQQTCTPTTKYVVLVTLQTGETLRLAYDTGPLVGRMIDAFWLYPGALVQGKVESVC